MYSTDEQSKLFQIYFNEVCTMQFAFPVDENLIVSALDFSVSLLSQTRYLHNAVYIDVWRIKLMWGHLMDWFLLFRKLSAGHN